MTTETKIALATAVPSMVVFVILFATVLACCCMSNEKTETTEQKKPTPPQVVVGQDQAEQHEQEKGQKDAAGKNRCFYYTVLFTANCMLVLLVYN